MHSASFASFLVLVLGLSRDGLTFLRVPLHLEIIDFSGAPYKLYLLPYTSSALDILFSFLSIRHPREAIAAEMTRHAPV